LRKVMAMSLSVDAPLKAHGHGIVMWLSRNKVTSQLNQTAY